MKENSLLITTKIQGNGVDSLSNVNVVMARTRTVCYTYQYTRIRIIFASEATRRVIKWVEAGLISDIENIEIHMVFGIDLVSFCFTCPYKHDTCYCSSVIHLTVLYLREKENRKTTVHHLHIPCSDIPNNNHVYIPYHAQECAAKYAVTIC